MNKKLAISFRFTDNGPVLGPAGVPMMGVSGWTDPPAASRPAPRLSSCGTGVTALLSLSEKEQWVPAGRTGLWPGLTRRCQSQCWSQNLPESCRGKDWDRWPGSNIVSVLSHVLLWRNYLTSGNTSAALSNWDWCTKILMTLWRLADLKPKTLMQILLHSFSSSLHLSFLNFCKWALDAPPVSGW